MSDLLHQAHLAINASRLDDARDLLARAAREPSTDPGLLLCVQAGVAVRERDFALAIALLDRAAAIRPFDHAVFYNLGLAYYELGRFDEAIAAHRNSLRLNMSYAKAWMKLGACHLLSQHWAEALACQRMVIDLAPDSRAAEDLREIARGIEAALPAVPEAFNAGGWGAR